MGTLLTADLDALRALSARQMRCAESLRDIDLRSVFLALGHGLAGSAISAECRRAGAAAETAIAVVADRVDGLAAMNRTAASRIGAADEEYASGVRALADRF